MSVDRITALERRMEELHGDMRRLDDELAALRQAALATDKTVSTLTTDISGLRDALGEICDNQERNHNRLKKIELKLTGSASVAFLIIYLVMRYLGLPT